MEGLLIGLIVAFVGQGALMWFKIGKLEGKIEDVCRSNGYEPPTICTPQELMEDYSDGT